MKNSTWFTGLLIAVTLGAAPGGYAQTATGDAGEPYASMTLEAEGPDGRETLKSFYEGLLADLKVGDIKERNMHCDGCEVLGGQASGADVAKLTLFFPAGDSASGQVIAGRCLSAIASGAKLKCTVRYSCGMYPPLCYFRAQYPHSPTPFCCKNPAGPCRPCLP